MIHRRYIHVSDETKSFDEEVVHDDANQCLLACSPHGGMIEKYTARQAMLLRDILEGCSAWICRGFKTDGGAYDEFHRPSTEIAPDSFRYLPMLFDHGFESALSFHGFDQEGILVGGGASKSLKDSLCACLREYVSQPVNTAPTGPYSGTSEANFINQVGKVGFQLEQGPNVREESWQTVVAAVQVFFSERLDNQPAP